MELIIFGGDSSHCYFSPKLKITRTLGTTVQKGLALFARCQPPLPKEVKRNFVPREKDSSDPNGRCHHPEEERNTLFVRSASSLKEGSFPRRPTTSLPGEENQPRLIRETSTLVTEIKRNSSQREQPHSQGFSPLRGRRARKEFRREFKDLFAVKGFFPIPVILR